MSVARFSVGNSGTAGANASYITRQPDAEKISLFNLGHLIANDNFETRTNAIAYAYSREDVEKGTGKNARVHYRMILSWDRKEDSDKAAFEAEKYLEKILPKSRAILAVHQDTDNTHVHIWIDARQMDDRKINLRGREYLSLDEKWTKQYDESYGTSFADEYKAKKVQTRKFKQLVASSKNQSPEIQESIKIEFKPDHIDKFSAKYWRQKELERITTEKGLFGNIEESGNAQISEKYSVLTATLNEKNFGKLAENKHTGLRTNIRQGIGQEIIEVKNEQKGHGDCSGTLERENQFIRNPKSTLKYSESDTRRVIRTTETESQRAIEEKRNIAELASGDGAEFEHGHFPIPENGTDYQRQSEIRSRDFEGQNEQSSGTFPDRFSVPNSIEFTKKIDSQEIFSDEFYRTRLGEDENRGGFACNELSRFIATVEGYQPINTFQTDSIEPVEITLQTVELAHNTTQLVDEMLAMTQESLNRQKIEISERAWVLMQEALVKNSEIEPMRETITLAQQINKTLSKNEQIQTDNTSQLEISYDILSKSNDNMQDRSFSASAIEVEKVAEDEKAQKIRSEQKDVEIEVDRGFDFDL